jgi:hypothetical protein
MTDDVAHARQLSPGSGEGQRLQEREAGNQIARGKEHPALSGG